MASLLPPELNTIVPQGVNFDGECMGGLLQFTITDKAEKAFGATFHIRRAEISSAVLARRVHDVHAQFRAPSEPLPPLFNRQPRVFVAAETNHY